MSIGLVIIFGTLYLIPSMVAAMRGHRNGLAIGVLNILLGWTVLGWILALVWASTGNIESAAPPTKPLVKCPECAELIQPDAKRCRYCHCVVAEAPRRCGDCGRTVAPADKHCPVCGFSLT